MAQGGCSRNRIWKRSGEAGNKEQTQCSFSVPAGFEERKKKKQELKETQYTQFQDEYTL